jgi:fermentation-respiration switch protein FrsA (DUF1100 family)
MRRILVSIIIVIASVYVGVAGILYAYQRDFIYFPDMQRPIARLAGVKPLREIELVTSDGLRLLAWYVPPPEGKPVLIYFHGNGGNIGYRSPRLSEFTSAGLGVLMPEYRGYGGNEGQPTEVGLYADATAAMAFLQSEGVGAERIIVYGESLGTGVATRVASEHQVAALVLEAPYTSITAMAALQFSFLPVNLMLSDRYDSLSRIAEVRAPILIFRGERDEIVPPALGCELFEAAREPKEFWAVPEAGHNDLYRYGAAETVLDFLRRRVPAIN